LKSELLVRYLAKNASILSIILSAVGVIITLILGIWGITANIGNVSAKIDSLVLTKGFVIDSPNWGQAFDSPQVKVSGSAIQIPKDMEIWLFVIPDGANQLYPQERLPSDKPDWSLEVSIGTEELGKNQWYWLMLGAVRANEDELLESQKCLNTAAESCPGTENSFDVRWLDAVHVRRN